MRRNARGDGLVSPILVALLVVAGAFLLVGLAFASIPQTGAVAQSGESAYLPILTAPLPTPTPGPPPQFVEKVDIPKAMCPNDADFNTTSGHIYITNNFSDNVSTFKDRQFLTNINTGEWPSVVTNDTASARAWVTNLHEGVSLIDGGVQVGFVPKDYEPYAAAFNPVNGYVYVTDLDSKVQIIDGDQLLTTLALIDPDTGGDAGAMLPVVADPYTGLVYAASFSHGFLYVFEGTRLIDSVRLGWGPSNMALDAKRGWLYVAHGSPNEIYPHEISVVDVATLTVTPIDTPSRRAQDVVVDPISGIAYVTNPYDDYVTILRGTERLGEAPVGDRPWGTGVNPNDGHVFITNRDSRSVSIFRDGLLLTTIPTEGLDPYAVTVDTLNNDIYIANRGRQDGNFDCKHASVSILH